MEDVIDGSALLAAATASSAASGSAKADDLSYDLGVLAAFDSHPLDSAALAANKEETLLKAATENTQLLINQIFSLPVEKLEVGPTVSLPEPTTRFPRAKPVPKPKALTKWQAFALDKGITKNKKRDGLGKKQFDEATGEFVPQFRNKKPSGTLDPDWLVEVKPGKDGEEDPWARKDAEKKQRVIKNQLNHLKNLGRAAKAEERRTGAGGGAAMLSGDGPSGSAGAGGAGKKRKRNESQHAGSASGALPVGIPNLKVSEGAVGGFAGPGKMPRQHVKEDKGVKAAKLKLAQTATASMGRFDAIVAGEPPKPKDPRKHKRLPNEIPLFKERARDVDVLRKVLGGTGEGEKKASAGAGAGAAAGGAGGGKRGKHGGKGKGDKGGKGGKGGREALAGKKRKRER